MGEVLRNRNKEIVDSQGNPLEQAARYMGAERRVANDEATAAADLTHATISAGDMEAGQRAKSQQEAAEARLAKADARGVRHFEENRAGYEAAAHEEDDYRTNGLPELKEMQNGAREAGPMSEEEYKNETPPSEETRR